jgi:chemotaxis protein MotB
MKKQIKNGQIQARTWQMSFNDLLTVLLTFFILLVSVSNIRANKMQDFSASTAEAFKKTQVSDQRTTLIRALGAIDGIEVYATGEAVSITLRDSLLYASGSADIIRKDFLRQVGEKLKSAEASITIEGHTDNIPVANNSFPSNWELSTQRAINVVKFLADECGIDPRKLSAAGYADSRPVSSNDDPKGRASNRRVNMIISMK